MPFSNVLTRPLASNATKGSRFGFLFERITFGTDGSTGVELPSNFTAWTTFNWEELEQTLLDTAVEVAIDLLLAIIIIVIGFLIIALLSRAFMAIARRREWDKTICGWLNSAIKALLKLIVLIIALNVLGLNMSTLTLLLAAFGVAVSSALGSIVLNFVCGVALMVMKPIHVGDWVVSSGCEGVVEEIGMVAVTLCHWNNTIYVIPNKNLFNSVITNCSVLSKRRLDIFITVPFVEDLDAVRDCIMHTLKSNPYVMASPRPFVNVEYVDGSRISLYVNPWVRKPDDPFFYITFMWDIREEIIRDMRKAKLRFGVDCVEIGFHMGDQQRAPDPSPKNVHEAEKLLESDYDYLAKDDLGDDSKTSESKLRLRLKRKKDDPDAPDDEKEEDNDDTQVIDAI